MTEPYHSPHWEILDAMEKYGGSFVCKLAMLYRSADLENQMKLATTFENYFLQYDELVTSKKKSHPWDVELR